MVKVLSEDCVQIDIDIYYNTSIIRIKGKRLTLFTL